MNRPITSVLALAVLLGMPALFSNSRHAVSAAEKAEALLATDGAFRDGLFVGRLSAEWGRAPRPTIGRWSSERDRASFVAGYQRGYKQGVSERGGD
jgi:hypothetical protein